MTLCGRSRRPASCGTGPPTAGCWTRVPLRRRGRLGVQRPRHLARLRDERDRPVEHGPGRRDWPASRRIVGDRRGLLPGRPRAGRRPRRRPMSLWKLPSLAPLGTLEGHEDDVSAMTFTADGTQLTTAGDDHKIRVWDVRSKTLVREMRGHTDRVPGWPGTRPASTCVGRLGHDRPRLGAGQGRPDDPPERPLGPGERGRHQPRRRAARLCRLGLYHPRLGRPPAGPAEVRPQRAHRRDPGPGLQPGRDAAGERRGRPRRPHLGHGLRQTRRRARTRAPATRSPWPATPSSRPAGTCSRPGTARPASGPGRSPTARPVHFVAASPDGRPSPPAARRRR